MRTLSACNVLQLWIHSTFSTAQPGSCHAHRSKQRCNSQLCAEGVRNFKARNILRAMQPGQQCFFYHSNCKQPGVVGIMEVARGAYPDHTQFDSSSQYHDAKSKEEEPRWSMVDVKLVCHQCVHVQQWGRRWGEFCSCASSFSTCYATDCQCCACIVVHALCCTELPPRSSSDLAQTPLAMHVCML